MKRTLLKTGDGSYTLHIPEWDEQYHSKHGAIAEALHVFIKEGLYHWFYKNSSTDNFNYGNWFWYRLKWFSYFFGSRKKQFEFDYTGIEAYPLKLG